MSKAVELGQALMVAAHFAALLEGAALGWPNHADYLLSEEYCQLSAAAYERAEQLADELKLENLAGQCKVNAHRLLDAAEKYRAAIEHTRKSYQE